MCACMWKGNANCVVKHFPPSPVEPHVFLQSAPTLVGPCTGMLWALLREERTNSKQGSEVCFLFRARVEPFEMPITIT